MLPEPEPPEYFCHIHACRFSGNAHNPMCTIFVSLYQLVLRQRTFSNILLKDIQFLEKETDMEHFTKHIRTVMDFPKTGIAFKDIAPLLANPGAFKEAVAAIAEEWDGKIDAIAALDARGFLFGGALALQMGLPVVMIRKKGKLPGACLETQYALEYGEAVIEVQEDAFIPGARVLVVDDLLATGGTAAAACALIEQAGAKIAGCAFVIELTGLGGRDALAAYDIQALVAY
jgi:adenine phosphoribosyltransferase